MHMTRAPLPIALFEHEDVGRPVTALTADLAVYLDQPLNAHADALSRMLETFFSFVPRSTMTWFGTESTTKDKPCSARTFSIPQTWYRKGSPKKDERALQIRDGAEYNSVPRSGLRLSSHELEEDEDRPFEPSLIRFMFPAQAVHADPAPLLSLARQLADELPLASGHSGFCIERNYGYYQTASMLAAYPVAMRFQGVDIDCPVSDVMFDHLKTINWLTIVGDALLARVGGRQAARALVSDPSVVVHEHKHALIFQAGDQPRLGDVNRGEWLPAYRAVYRALADLFAPEFTPSFDATSPPDALLDQDKTETWYRRFERDIADQDAP
jgi:hypothetical protein